MNARFPFAPARIAALPVDHRGFPVPFFVAWKDGQPVFPALDPDKLVKAIRHDLCWVCGQRLGRFRVYVIGPMCIANRISSEPPSHDDCARFAAVNCPFLANPRMGRVPADRYGGTKEATAGVMLEHNPGVTALATCEGKTHWFKSGNGVLFDVKPISSVEWFAEGREASRAEVLLAFELGLPHLRELAEQEGPAALLALDRAEAAARELFPA